MFFRLPLLRAVRGRFVVVAALSLAGAAGSFWSVVDALGRAQLVAHTHEVLAGMQETLALLKDAENGQRGYLLSGDAAQLEPYREAASLVVRRLDALAELTRDNRHQQARIAVVRGLAIDRLDQLRQTLAYYDTGRQGAVAARLRAGTGRVVMDRIRSIFGAMQAEERDLLAQREAGAEAAARSLAAMAVAGALTVMLALAVAYRLIAREMARRAWCEAELRMALDAQLEDIIERKRVEAALRESEERFRAFMEHSPAVAFMKDDQSRIVYLNKPMERSFNLRLEDVGGQVAFPGMPAAGVEEALRNDRSVFESGQPSQMLEVVPTPDGRLRSWQVMKFPFRDADGRMMLGGIALDVTEQKELERRLEEANAQLEILAASDALTGLCNRRAVGESLVATFSRASRYDEPLSVLMLDVDDFKLFNDKFGHLAGDDVLKALARILHKLVRSSDVVGRYGGEEFIVVLPETDVAGAVGLAARLRAALAGQDWPLRRITVSIGAASREPGMADASVLVADADRALYESQRRGRDRVTHAQDMRAEPASCRGRVREVEAAAPIS